MLRVDPDGLLVPRSSDSGLTVIEGSMNEFWIGRLASRPSGWVADPYIIKEQKAPLPWPLRETMELELTLN
jgi:hypothetical protein